MRMTKTPRLPIGLILVAGFACAGCSGRDAERIARVSNKALERASTVTEAAGQQVAQRIGLSRPGDEPIELSARVARRLSWDQVLEGAAIQVRADHQGVALTGTVRNEVQRQRAMDLAQSTVGVGEVREALEIAAQGKKLR